MTDSTPLSALNAQLMNHGWAKRPLSLDALDDRSRIDVVTTMFEMLGAHVVSPPTAVWTLRVDFT